VSVRPLGSTAPWTEIAASSVGRAVYEATLPAQTEDFEYKVEAGAATYPASAPQTVATVTVASQPGSSTDPSSAASSPTPPTQEILTTGVPQVGATLTVDPELILATNETTLFAYQWRRGGSPIAGATSPSYSPTSADLGTALSVAVTYTDLAGNPQEAIASFPGVVQAAASAHTFFVAPTGNDSNDGSASAPWRTLDGARQNVRAYLDGSGPITVQFRTGHYPLASTVVFSSEDSGTADQIVTYRAADGATPVFSSLQEVTGWTTDPSNPAISIAPLPAGVGPVRFLYSSRSDWLERSATAEFTTTEEAVDPGQVENTTDRLERQDERSNFRYPADFAFPDPSRISQYDLRQSIIGWHMEILPLTGIDTEQRRAYTGVPGCYELREDTTEPRPAGFWILNSYEGLDSPGEWAVLDGSLYLYGRDPAARIFVPTLTELVRVDDGTNGRDDPVTAPVSHLRFEGLTFTGGDFYLMKDTRGPTLADRQKEITIQHDWAVVDKPTGLLRLRNTADIEVRGCTFTKSGGSGLRVDRYGQNLRILDNEFSHLGRTGLSLIGRGPGYGNVNHSNVIAGNTFEATGQEKWAAPALVLDQTTSNLVKHNAFLNTDFTAITVTGPRQMGILSKAEKLDAAADNPATALDYDGREFHYYGMAPSFEAFLASTEEYVLDPAKAALDAMQFVYNYDNYIEENLFLDVGDGANRFFNGKAAYLSGGTRDPDPAVVRKNYFRYNYLHDTHPQSYADYAWYNDYDQDGAEMSGNILTNIASPGMPLVLATSGYAEGGLGREPISVQANLVLGSTDNGTFVADGNDQGVAGIELQGNLVDGVGGASGNLGDYERMLAFVQRGAVGSTPLPVDGAVSAALTETIAALGGTVPAPAGNAGFGRIVSFGDSLSDRGNNGIASNGTITWVDALSGYLGLGRSMPSLQGGFNYAYGGAVTGTPDDDSVPPSAVAQVYTFYAEHSSFAPDDLVTLWIGGNDFLENPSSPLPAETLKDRYTTILQGLVDLGATTILWAYVPDYGLLPDYPGEAATAYAASVNAVIDEVRAAMLAQNENLRIVLFDFPALQAELEQDYAEYQLAAPPSTKTPDGADAAVLAERFLMADGVHPTTTGHEIIAAEALRTLQSSLAASRTAVQLAIRASRDPVDSGLLEVFLEAKGNGRHLLQRSTDLQNWTTLTPVEIVEGAHTTHRKESETPVFYRLATP
jgi:phospholipase/lecithinase/hemolysin